MSKCVRAFECLCTGVCVYRLSTYRVYTCMLAANFSIHFDYLHRTLTRSHARHRQANNAEQTAAPRARYLSALGPCSPVPVASAQSARAGREVDVRRAVRRRYEGLAPTSVKVSNKYAKCSCRNCVFTRYPNSSAWVARHWLSARVRYDGDQPGLSEAHARLLAQACGARRAANRPSASK